MTNPRLEDIAQAREIRETSMRPEVEPFGIQWKDVPIGSFLREKGQMVKVEYDLEWMGGLWISVPFSSKGERCTEGWTPDKWCTGLFVPSLKTQLKAGYVHKAPYQNGDFFETKITRKGNDELTVARVRKAPTQEVLEKYGIDERTYGIVQELVSTVKVMEYPIVEEEE